MLVFQGCTLESIPPAFSQGFPVNPLVDPPAADTLEPSPVPEILAARAYFAQDKLACSEVPSSLGFFGWSVWGKNGWIGEVRDT